MIGHRAIQPIQRLVRVSQRFVHDGEVERRHVSARGASL